MITACRLLPPLARWGALWSMGIAAALSAGPARADAADSAACDDRPAAWDQREVRCTLPLPAAGAGAWVFRARFAGGHDDTDCSMSLSLDGQPLACGPGSKTELFGEDGDVALHCQIPVDAAGARAPRVLVARIRYRHADYVASSLSAR